MNSNRQLKLITVRINDQAVQVPATSTISQLTAYRMDFKGPIAVEKNGEIVPRHEHAHTSLQDGDRLEIVSLTGGG